MTDRLTPEALDALLAQIWNAFPALASELEAARKVVADAKEEIAARRERSTVRTVEDKAEYLRRSSAAFAELIGSVAAYDRVMEEQR